MNAAYWISKLGLLPHPEGGWFREIYRSNDIINSELLPEGQDLSQDQSNRWLSLPKPPLMPNSGQRNLCTSIYFLLESGNFSAFHRLRSDELWHFYSGSALTVYQISPDGELRTDILTSGEEGCPFVCIPRHTWFAAEVDSNNSFALIGCTVSPGFDFSDFELAQRKTLTETYSQHSALIKRLTRK